MFQMFNTLIRMDVPQNHNAVPTASTNEPALPTNNSKVQPPIKNAIEIFNEPIRPIEPVIDNMVQVAK